MLLLSACGKTHHHKPVHYKTKVVKKVVHVHDKNDNHRKLKPVPPIANLKHKHGMPHYRILNDPVVVLTFHNIPGKSTNARMTKYLNSIENIDQYHMQISTSGNTTYITLKQLSNNYQSSRSIPY